MKKIFTSCTLSLCLLLSISLNAQITPSSQWTWMNGDNFSTIGGSMGVYGVREVANDANKPGGRELSATWTDAAGFLWLFGGVNYESGNFFNDVWRYNPANNQWAWMNGDSSLNQLPNYGIKGVAAASNKPGARSTAVTWTDASGNLFLFGGHGFMSNGRSFLNDFWKYSPSTKLWTWLGGRGDITMGSLYGTQGIAAAANMPGARYGSVKWTDASGNFWLFGGIGFWPGDMGYELGNLNDLWKYNPLTNEWTWINGATTGDQKGTYGTLGTPNGANRPGGRQKSMAWTDASGNFWLFGGEVDRFSNPNFLNDLWKYNPNTNLWTWVHGASIENQPGVYGNLGVAAEGNMPGARKGSATWTDASGNLWLFGGYSKINNGNVQFNDLWKYSPSTNHWTWVKGDKTTNQGSVYGPQGIAGITNKPGSRGNSVSWSDASGNFWLFSGTTDRISSLNDLWKLSNVSTLPVTFANIKAYQQNNNIAVEWRVENENGTKHYDVEKSTDGVTFARVGLQAASGNNNSKVNYSWLNVNAPPGNNYYRIRSTSLNGEIKYSQVVKVTISQGKGGYNIYPNPVANGLLQLQFINQAKGVYQVRILNRLGQVILVSQIPHENGSSTETIQLSNKVNKGNYTLEVIAPNKSRQSLQFVN